MAWGRLVELNIGVGGSLGKVISGLNIDFNIKKSVDAELNTAEFVIYNPTDSTITDILKNGNNVQFKAGYEDEDNIASIFIGTIKESKSAKKDNTKVVNILAVDLGSNKNKFDAGVVSKSYKSDTPLDSVIQDFASELNIPIAGLSNISGVKLPNGIVFACSVNNALKQLQNVLLTNECGLYFDNAELVIYKLNNADSRYEVVSVSAKSGLLGEIEDITEDGNPSDVVTEKVKKRIKIRSLLNPKIVVNGAIRVDANVKGAFIVKNVEHNGNNYGGEFITIAECEE